MDYFNSGYGNYVIAGGDCIVHFLTPHIGELYTAEQVKNHLSNNVNRLLYSFGARLSKHNNKIDTRRVARISREVDKIRNCPFTSDSPLSIDSGGYQVCMGYVNYEKIPDYINIYSDFIQKKHKDFSMCFSLDLPISRSGIFKTYSQMEYYNEMSYKAFSNFSPEIKKQIYYIHHYSSPKVYDIFLRFLNDCDYANGFTNFSSPPESSLNSSVAYSIPLSDIVTHCKKVGLTSFNFHALGGASSIDTFLYQLISKHIEYRHGIKVRITYDSSTLFKGIAVGRSIRLFKRDNMLYTGDIHSNNIHTKFDREKSLEDKMYDSINEMSQHYGFKILDPVQYPLYNPDGKTNMKVYCMLILQQMNIYRRVELMCEEAIEDIYSYYKEDNMPDFIDSCMKFLAKICDGRVTRKVYDYCSSLPQTMRVLEMCDTGFNKYILAHNSNDFPEMYYDNQIPI